MKLLLDENISLRLVKFLQKDFPGSSHISFLNMQGYTDTQIWELAKQEHYIIVSKDNDFRQRSFLLGFPPKVIWLSIGNGGLNPIKDLLLNNIAVIERFYHDLNEGLLVLELNNARLNLAE